MTQRTAVLNSLVRMYEQQGCTVTRATGGRWRVSVPGGGVIMMHRTPRSNEAQLRKLAQVTRKHGLAWTFD